MYSRYDWPHYEEFSKYEDSIMDLLEDGMEELLLPKEDYDRLCYLQKHRELWGSDPTKPEFGKKYGDRILMFQGPYGEVVIKPAKEKK